MSWVEGSLAYLSFPRERAINFSYISLNNLANCLHKEKKWLGQKVNLPSQVTLLTSPTFLHINSLACPVGITHSGPESQRMPNQSSLRQRDQPFLAYKHSLNFTQLGE